MPTMTTSSTTLAFLEVFGVMQNIWDGKSSLSHNLNPSLLGCRRQQGILKERSGGSWRTYYAPELVGPV